MGRPVVTVASGGMAVVDVTSTTKVGNPVSEATNGFGQAVTKVASGGMAVVYGAPDTGSGPVIYTTWNPADQLNMTLTNGNLTATATNATARVRAVKGTNTGKYYFEGTITSPTSFAVYGIANASAVNGQYTNWAYIQMTGSIYVNTSTIQATLSGVVSGSTIGVAVDLGANLIWFRRCPSGSWNAASGSTNDPASGIGGFSVSSIASGPLFPIFGVANSGDSVVGNFGASGFNGAVPSGFAGWTA